MGKINWRLLALSAVLAVTAIFQMGYTNAYPNTAIASFRLYMNESSDEPMTMSKSEFEWAWSAMLAVYFIGFAAGSVISAGIADRIGRKWTLCLGTFGSLLSAIIALFSIILKMPTLFGFSRLVMSLSAAISMNGLILLFQESSPTHMKGLISFNAEMAFVVTNLIGGLFGMQAVLGQNLVGLIAISIVPSAVACFLSVFLKESPKYLFLTKNDGAEAGRALKFYQNITDDEEKANVLNELKMEREEMSNQRNGSIFDIMSCQPTRRGFLLGFATMQLTASLRTGGKRVNYYAFHKHIEYNSWNVHSREILEKMAADRDGHSQCLSDSRIFTERNIFGILASCKIWMHWLSDSSRDILQYCNGTHRLVHNFGIGTDKLSSSGTITSPWPQSHRCSGFSLSYISTIQTDRSSGSGPFLRVTGCVMHTDADILSTGDQG
ncbi:unnamed protein product [Caenorhabditis sp. 36 PRJEB53466]|nr:unnamed protein product [Caenorhabditis sp. 36 PRJEB53466]